MSDIYAQNSNSLSEDRIKALITDVLRDIPYDKGRDNFVIISLEGVDILYPALPELDGQNILNLRDVNGKFVTQEINDTYGHPQGDDCLITLAAVCRRELRHTDILGRWGGEEFVFLLKYTRLQQAGQIAERLRKAVKGTFFCNQKIQVTCSLGVVQMQDRDDPDSLIKRADENLYQAKRSGRDKVVAG
ncbi:MAG: diguanylate cyclase [Desulfohalobiaceae bacterium]|nr:diguanylate cyclase [Desulfohalobiaceae bacterium]